MQPQSVKYLTLWQAIRWILLSTLCISGSAALIYSYYAYARSKRNFDSRYHIATIVQTGPEREALQTMYLMEILGLSVDRPTNLYQFNVKNAEKMLCASPLIKKAVVKKLHPNSLYIDYIKRHPIAFLGDYSNTVIDEEGILFPFQPFFTPKNLPVVYLGIAQQENFPAYLKSKVWGNHIQENGLPLAFEVLNVLKEEMKHLPILVRGVDVSEAAASSYGQREIVVELEEWVDRQEETSKGLQAQRRMLRLNPENYREGFKRYFDLRHILLTKYHEAVEDITVVDLRIPRLAFIKKEKKGKNQ